MRYYGGGIGHRGNARANATDTAMDDEDITSEWQDVDEDLAKAQAAEEQYVRRVAEQQNALQRLVPEMAAGHTGDGRAALFDEVEQHFRAATGNGVVGDELGTRRQMLRLTMRIPRTRTAMRSCLMRVFKMVRM